MRNFGLRLHPSVLASSVLCKPCQTLFNIHETFKGGFRAPGPCLSPEVLYKFFRGRGCQLECHYGITWLRGLGAEPKFPTLELELGSFGKEGSRDEVLHQRVAKERTPQKQPSIPRPSNCPPIDFKYHQIRTTRF